MTIALLILLLVYAWTIKRRLKKMATGAEQLKTAVERLVNEVADEKSKDESVRTFVLGVPDMVKAAVATALSNAQDRGAITDDAASALAGEINGAVDQIGEAADDIVTAVAQNTVTTVEAPATDSTSGAVQTDSVAGQTGDDTIDAGTSGDSLSGGQGNDSFVDTSTDSLPGSTDTSSGTFADTTGGTSTDSLSGQTDAGFGNDASVDTLSGGQGGDSVNSGAGDDQV